MNLVSFTEILTFLEIVANISQETWISGFAEKSVILHYCKESVDWRGLAAVSFGKST